MPSILNSKIRYKGVQWADTDATHCQVFPASTIQAFTFIDRAEAIFATIQEDAAPSCNQSPVLSGNPPPA